MEVFINNVRQEPDTSYSASGNTITFTAAVTASDSCYLIYQGQSVGSINPPANSVGGSQIQNTSVTHNHLHTNMDLSSKTVRIDAMDMGTGTNQWQLATQSAVSNRFALRSTHTTLGDGNPFIIYQPAGAGHQNDALVINDTGYVTHSKLPSFHAQYTSASAGSELTSWTVSYNNGNHFNASNGRFTAPVTGTYYFNFFGMTGGTGTFDVSLWTNGTDDNHMVPYQSPTGGTHVSSSGGAIKRLNVGDYVSLRNNNTALYATSNGRHNAFCGFLIG